MRSLGREIALRAAFVDELPPPPAEGERPRAGDWFVGCPHVVAGRPQHWLGLSMRVQRPDGTLFVARWLVVCEGCYERYCDDLNRCPMGMDGELLVDVGPEAVTVTAKISA